MQTSVVVATQEMVEIDVQPAIARDNEPAPEIGFTAD